MKSLGLCHTQQNTKLVQIENYEACVCEDYEALQAVVVKPNADLKHCGDLEEIPTDDLLFPLLSPYFPNNKKTTEWAWAKPRKIIFAKQCKDCPTYYNDCEYVYDMKPDGCLYFPQIEKGVTCVNYLTFPKLEEYMIDDRNQALIDALVSYVLKNYYEIEMQMDFTQQNKYLFELYSEKWGGYKQHAHISDMLRSLNIKDVSKIMNNRLHKMLKTINK